MAFVRDSLFVAVESIAVTYPGPWICRFVVLVRCGMSDGCEGYAKLEGLSRLDTQRPERVRHPRASRDLGSMGFKAPIRGADSRINTQLVPCAFWSLFCRSLSNALSAF